MVDFTKHHGKVVMKSVKQKVGLYGGIFLVNSALLLIILLCLHVSPFGDKSIMIWDMKIQYADFFSYLKDVLDGNVSMEYSFSKSLGGSMVATFAYYLSSPLNLLLIFFDQENIGYFFVFLTMIKVGLCGTTFSIFLKHRFLFLKKEWIVALSCAYALSQYVVTQMSNIMWIDGVYMLPIIMLGVYDFVKENKKKLLCISILVGIIINWYTGYMNCLFVPFYFLYELVLNEEKESGKEWIYEILKKGIKLVLFEGLSVLLSMAFFLPVILALLNGKGNVESSIFNIDFNGQFLNILRGFVIGSKSNSQEISFFCGTLCVFNVILFFCNKRIKRKEKYAATIMSIFLVMSCYFKPFENIWNGFRFVYSYYYRFSYIIICFFLYLAARNLQVQKKIEIHFYKKIALIIVILLFLFDTITPFLPYRLWTEVIICLAIVILVHYKRRYISNVLLCLLLICEMVLNAVLVCRGIYTYENEVYKNYVLKQNNQVEEIKKYNGDQFFRMEQTINREQNLNKTTAYFAESLAYDYNGISTYTSGFDYKVHKFVSDLGYSDSLDIAIYDEPILTSDSLLGIKYLLSDVAYPGWKEMTEISQNDDKKAFENEYALPLGMKVQRQNKTVSESDNPFLYQNSLFSNIMGKEIELYKKAIVEMKYEDGGISCSIKQNDNIRNGLLYGYGRFQSSNLKVYINDTYRCDYQKWLSYLVLNIGNTNHDNVVFFQGASEKDLQSEIEFYYLDMDLFEKIVSQLKEKEAKNTLFQDGRVNFKTNAEEGEYLLTTIPYESGWEAYVNGKKTEIYQADDIFISIPLSEGENTIVFEYHVKGRKEGIIISIVSLLILVGYWCWTKKKRKNKGE